jgi:Fic family protein
MYIYSLPDWPKFHWDEQFLAPRLTELKIKQARLLGRMEGLGPSYQAETHLRNLATELIRSYEIEGHVLDRQQVFDAFGRLLGLPGIKPERSLTQLNHVAIEHAETTPSVANDKHIMGLVEVFNDVTRNFEQPLFQIRLYGWHTAFLQLDQHNTQVVGRYRDNPREQPLKVVSGPAGRETVHFEAPESDRIPDEMGTFIKWFNEDQLIDPILKAGVAHIWFLNIYPFSAGNGVMARLISEMLLCRADFSPQRYFSLSAQIRKERNQYFAVLERAGKDSMDITTWLAWFIDCLHRAINTADDAVSQKLNGLRIRDKINALTINERQRLMLNKMAEDRENPVTSSHWARITSSSQDSAGRDINDLLIRKILVKEIGGGRSTSYSLNPKTF